MKVIKTDEEIKKYLISVDKNINILKRKEIKKQNYELASKYRSISEKLINIASELLVKGTKVNVTCYTIDYEVEK